LIAAFAAPPADALVAARAGALGDHGRGGRGHAGQVLGVPDHAADGLPWRRWAVMSTTTRAGVSKSATTSRLPAALLHLWKWSSHLASAPFHATEQSGGDCCFARRAVTT
jgi:hypothetical protein